MEKFGMVLPMAAFEPARVLQSVKIFRNIGTGGCFVWLGKIRFIAL